MKINLRNKVLRFSKINRGMAKNTKMKKEDQNIFFYLSRHFQDFLGFSMIFHEMTRRKFNSNLKKILLNFVLFYYIFLFKNIF